MAALERACAAQALSRSCYLVRITTTERPSPPRMRAGHSKWMMFAGNSLPRRQFPSAASAEFAEHYNAVARGGTVGGVSTCDTDRAIGGSRGGPAGGLRLGKNDFRRVGRLRRSAGRTQVQTQRGVGASRLSDARHLCRSRLNVWGRSRAIRWHRKQPARRFDHAQLVGGCVPSAMLRASDPGVPSAFSFVNFLLFSHLSSLS